MEQSDGRHVPRLAPLSRRPCPDHLGCGGGGATRCDIWRRDDQAELAGLRSTHGTCVEGKAPSCPPLPQPRRASGVQHLCAHLEGGTNRENGDEDRRFLLHRRPWPLRSAGEGAPMRMGPCSPFAMGSRGRPPFNPPGAVSSRSVWQGRRSLIFELNVPLNVIQLPTVLRMHQSLCSC
jgi:hypothetical protein